MCANFTIIPPFFKYPYLFDLIPHFRYAEMDLKSDLASLCIHLLNDIAEDRILKSESHLAYISLNPLHSQIMNKVPKLCLGEYRRESILELLPLRGLYWQVPSLCHSSLWGQPSAWEGAPRCHTITHLVPQRFPSAQRHSLLKADRQASCVQLQITK